MKKNIFFVVIACLFFVSGTVRVYFQAGFPYTHDGENHIARFANYKLALREGQLPPRFAPYLLNGYGYPVFNYNYPLANIVSVPLSLIGFSYETTFKILVFSFLLLGSVSLWLLLDSVHRSSKLIGLLLWLSAPFLISLIVYRGSIGEILVYGLLPTLFLVITNMVKSKKGSLWHIITWALFFLAHTVSVLWVTPLLVVYFLLFWNSQGRDVQVLRTFASVVLLSFGTSLWFWIPALSELDQVVLSEAENTLSFAAHFPTLRQLLFSPVEFGFSFPGSVDTLTFAIGSFTLLVLCLFPIWFFTSGHKKTPRTNLSIMIPWMWTFATGLILFQMQITQWIWSVMPLLRFIQFPWRLGLAIPLLGACIMAYLSSFLRPRYRYALVLFLLVHWIFISSKQPIDTFSHPNEYYDSFSLTTMTQNENTAKSFTYADFSQNPRQPIVLSGRADISSVIWRGSYRTYAVTAHTQAQIVEPTMQFIGWETTANDSLVSYDSNTASEGRISYTLEPGSYLISTNFTQKTPARRIGNTISLVVIVWIGVSAWESSRRKLHKIRHV